MKTEIILKFHSDLTDLQKACKKEINPSSIREVYQSFRAYVFLFSNEIERILNQHDNENHSFDMSLEEIHPEHLKEFQAKSQEHIFSIEDCHKKIAALLAENDPEIMLSIKTLKEAQSNRS